MNSATRARRESAGIGAPEGRGIRDTPVRGEGGGGFIKLRIDVGCDQGSIGQKEIQIGRGRGQSGWNTAHGDCQKHSFSPRWRAE